MALTKIQLLISERSKLTKAVIDVLPPDTLFYITYSHNRRIYAYRGYGNGWQILATPEQSTLMYSMLKDNLSVVVDRKLIRKYVPCTDSALSIYDYDRFKQADAGRFNKH
jgi:hypothetical protein